MPPWLYDGVLKITGGDVFRSPTGRGAGCRPLIRKRSSSASTDGRNPCLSSLIVVTLARTGRRLGGRGRPGVSRPRLLRVRPARTLRVFPGARVVPARAEGGGGFGPQ